MPDLIKSIQKADKTIKGEKPNPLCPWCGVNTRAWKECFGEEHATAICNWKEQGVIDLLHEFACNYEPHNPSISDTSIQVREYAYRIAKKIKEG